MIPVRTSDPFAAWPDDYVCDACCAVGELVDVDGDRLCRTCADKWLRPDPEEVAELDRALRHAAPDRRLIAFAALEAGRAA